MAGNDGRERDNESPAKMMSLIGRLGTWMLVICIPLCASMMGVAGGAVLLLPLAVILGTALAIIVVWSNSMPNKPGAVSQADQAEEIAALQQQIAELNDRLGNLEMIDSFERRLAERQTPTATSPISPEHTQADPSSYGGTHHAGGIREGQG